MLLDLWGDYGLGWVKIRLPHQGLDTLILNSLVRDICETSKNS